MKKNKMLFMISCKEATTVLAEESRLSLMGKIRLKIHLAICPLCRSFENQMQKLKLAIRKNMTQELTEQDKQLSKRIEDKIVSEIKRKN